jgi:hypothetical protein
MNNNIPLYPRMLTGRLLQHEIVAQQMRAQQPEALRWAGILYQQAQNYGAEDYRYKAAAELRRLHEVNQEMLAALKVAALAIHQYRTLGAPHAYWDDVEYQAAEAIAKGEAK